MNERLVEFVAQTISAMSDEERQLLESKLRGANVKSPLERIQSSAPTAPVSSAPLSENKVLVHPGGTVANSSEFDRTARPEHRLSSDVEEGEPPMQSELLRIPSRDSETTRQCKETREDGENEESAYSFFRLAQSLQLDGPADWSENVDHYLYGTPKVQND